MNTPETEVTKLVALLIHMREPYDSHGDRVANLAVRLGAAVCMGADELPSLAIAAKLHDIGKLMVRLEILNATRKLSDPERAEMQNHTRLGWKIAATLGYGKMTQDAVLMHHEKIDGTGYPYGLRGEEIPLPVQIISICDVYEAMTNVRPYRAAYSHDFTRIYIQHHAGTHFSPQLVKLFFEKAAAA